MGVMHILCVNLEPVFFFCLFWAHETDGGIYIFHVFLLLVLSIIKVVLEVYHLWLPAFVFIFQIEALSFMLYFYDIRATIEQDIMLLTTIQRTSLTLKVWKCLFSFFSFSAIYSK